MFTCPCAPGPASGQLLPLDRGCLARLPFVPCGSYFCYFSWCLHRAGVAFCVQPLPQVGDRGRSSVSASICWTSTGSRSLRLPMVFTGQSVQTNAAWLPQRASSPKVTTAHSRERYIRSWVWRTWCFPWTSPSASGGQRCRDILGRGLQRGLQFNSPAKCVLHELL